jgi:hypothetical protein
VTPSCQMGGRKGDGLWGKGTERGATAGQSESQNRWYGRYGRCRQDGTGRAGHGQSVRSGPGVTGRAGPSSTGTGRSAGPGDPGRIGRAGSMVRAQGRGRGGGATAWSARRGRGQGRASVGVAWRAWRGAWERALGRGATRWRQHRDASRRGPSARGREPRAPNPSHPPAPRPRLAHPRIHPRPSRVGTARARDRRGGCILEGRRGPHGAQHMPGHGRAGAGGRCGRAGRWRLGSRKAREWGGGGTRRRPCRGASKRVARDR